MPRSGSDNEIRAFILLELQHLKQGMGVLPYLSIYTFPLKLTYNNQVRVIVAQHYWSSGARMGGRPTSSILFFLGYCLLFTSFAAIIWFSILFTNMSFQCTSHVTFPYALHVMRCSEVSSDSEHITQRLFS